MMKNGIYFYKSGFLEYSKYCVGVMSEYPENCNDDHMCATFIFDGKEGFLQSGEGLIIARKIRQNCIEIGRIIACPRNDEIKSAISDYDEFALKKKKYTVISRHREIEEPRRHFLADLMENKVLDNVGYEFLIENSHFIARETYSEAHGFSAGVYNIAYRKGDICKVDAVRKAIDGYDCFRVSYFDLPIH